MNADLECPWLERVSASLDGEIPHAELEMVRAHATSCPTCREIIGVESTMPARRPARVSGDARFAGATVSRPRALRALLGVFGALLLALAIGNFLRGSASHEDLHDVRHLAVWQASLGVAVVALSVSFRLSLFITATTTSFLVFTTVATLVDLVMGHRGPWTDVTHVVEVVALIVLLAIVKPRIRLSRHARRQLSVPRRDS
jgi:hypothetical protein